MPKPRPIEKIRAAARHFATISNNIHEIATAFEVSTDTIRRWATQPEWQETLDALGYQGDRTFARTTRDTERERGEELENVRTAYFELLKAFDLIGDPPRRITRLVSEKTGVKQRTVYEWAKRYDWEKQYEEEKKS